MFFPNKFTFYMLGSSRVCYSACIVLIVNDCERFSIKECLL